MASIGIARAIEVAEHNGWYDGRTLRVFDSRKQDRYYGITLEVEPAAEAVGGWCARVYDGVGKGCNVWSPTGDRVDACTAALDGYLNIVNRGI